MIISSMTKKAMPRTRPTLRIRTYFREWRQYREMTLEAAAALSGLTMGSISAMERRTQGFTDHSLYALSIAYDCPVKCLFQPPPGADDIWDVWERTKPGDRAKLLEIAKTLAGPDDKRKR